ncbi:MAG: V-type ATPase subunit subunit G family protein [Candidatus Omnitrophica bacterium]|nr:V-type ATPase subunit subunit G family protein [Candidatus Omnitrophota bacterium]
MKEIVEMVLREEEEARARIEKAKAQAEGIINEARKEAALIIEETLTRVKELSIQKAEESQKQFFSEKENALKAARQESAALRKSREKDIPGIARNVFLRLINIGG